LKGVVIKLRRNFRKLLSLTLSLIFVLHVLQPVSADDSLLNAAIVWDGTIAEAYQRGTGTIDDPFIIISAAQLALVAQRVNAGLEANCFYELRRDIDLGALDWTPIGNATYPFAGNFDGKNFEIRNLSVGDSRPLIERPVITQADSLLADFDVQGAPTADFSQIPEAQFAPESVQNPESELLEAEKAAEAQEALDMALNGYNSTTSGSALTPLSTEASVYGAPVDYTGLFGYVSLGRIANISLSNFYVSGGLYTGGLVGYGASGAAIESIFVSGYAESALGAVGGIAGYFDGAITNCANIGTQTSYGVYSLATAKGTGGIVGEAAGNISGCYNSARVNSGGRGWVGGIAGLHNSGETVENCLNTAFIFGYSSATGGIVGSKTQGLINQCGNSGTIGNNRTSPSSYAGGVGGIVGSIEYSYNTGGINGYFAGGLAGAISGFAYRNYTVAILDGSQGEGGFASFLLKAA
jgi:hypothetical protein